MSLTNTFSVTLPRPGIARYSLDSSETPFLDVRVGDYVVINSPTDFADENQGEFEIIALRTAWNGSEWVQYFEVENDEAVTQAGPLELLTEEDMLFFRPKKGTIYTTSGPTVVLSQTTMGGFDVKLPATTRVVNRTEHSAAYFQPRRLKTVTGVFVLADGTLRITTSTAHGLSAGSQIFLDSVKPDLTAPDTVEGDQATTGNPGESDASQLTLWSQIRSDITARTLAGGAALANGQGLVTGGVDSGTYTNTCKRFDVLSTSVLPSGDAEGRTAYQYNWVATANLPSARAQHGLTGLTGTLAPQALLAGGRDGVGALSSVYLYDPDGNAWNAVTTGTLIARYGHVQTRVSDQNDDDIVYIVGGLTASTTATGSVQRFSPLGGGEIQNVMTEATPRFRSRGVDVGQGVLLVAGGARFVSLTETPRADCLVYDHDEDEVLMSGQLAVARMDHALVALGNGQAMAIGGTGRVLSRETANRVVGECEIWDLQTRRWRPAGHLMVPRTNPICHRVGDLVYVFGGHDGDDNPVDTTEIYNLRTGRWSTAPAAANIASDIGCVTIPMESELLLTAGGTDGDGDAVATARLFIPGSNTIAPLVSVNRPLTVTAIPSITEIEVQWAENQYGAADTGQVEIVAATDGIFDGPFLFDPEAGVAVTGTATTLARAIAINGQYQSLGVTDAADFPETGWLVVNFGRASQSQVFKYLGKISDTELAIDYNHRFEKAASISDTITFVSQRGAFVPTDPTTVGAFYVTASSAGRLAAQQALEDAAAGGFDLRIEVIYPGTSGLGRGDETYIWGGDE